MERYTEAEEFLRKAAESGEDGTVYEHYGDVLFKLGKTDQALEYWQKAKEAGGTSDKIDQKITDKQLYE
jgi:predicted negative regulator of RcsB-dependent stress response